jgi:outer membrane protein assembly factor BamB
VLWARELPGLAHSSPVLWGDAVYVTTAVSEAGTAELEVGLYGDIGAAEDDGVQRWVVYRIDRRTGEVVWERVAREGVPRQQRHTKSTHANSTPATDGEHVVAFFGSEGLYCYDAAGELLWKKDLGVLRASFFRVPEAEWGFASSPVIEGGVVYLQVDVIDGGFVAAFALDDGRELWRTPRQDVPTWSTPAVHELEGRRLVVVNGWKHIGAYDAATGAEVWRLAGGGDIPVPTPVMADGLVFVTNAHGDQSPIYAIRPGARGDISLASGASSNEHVAWSIQRGGAYMQTPLVLDGILYNCRDNGALTAYRSRTGEVLYQERLGGGGTGFTASPVAAGGRLYFTSEDGDVHVVKAGESFELLAVNPLGEVAMATPAIAEGVLYFRTRSRLLAVGAP